MILLYLYFGFGIIYTLILIHKKAHCKEVRYLYIQKHCHTHYCRFNLANCIYHSNYKNFEIKKSYEWESIVF